MALAREDEIRDRTGFVYKFCRQAPDLYATVLSLILSIPNDLALTCINYCFENEF